jgi:penicillin-binding protein 1A
VHINEVLEAWRMVAPLLDESLRVVPARNAYVMETLLQEVTRSGTAARAQATLRRLPWR